MVQDQTRVIYQHDEILRRPVKTDAEGKATLAFTPERTRDALAQLQLQFPCCEAVILSTCNRVELYTFAESAGECP